jgi:ABC-type sugar transport system ATPase subunit
VNDYIRVDNISKTFGPVVALHNVSLEIRKGEIHAIIGENGAGKSTLLKILCGELKQDAGKVFLAGQDIATLGEAIRKKVKMVHQELTVFDNLTVAENLFPDYIFNKRRGLINYQQLHQRAKEQLHLFEVDIRPAERMGDLSVAEQQIVEILRVTSLFPGS